MTPLARAEQVRATSYSFEQVLGDTSKPITILGIWLLVGPVALACNAVLVWLIGNLVSNPAAFSGFHGIAGLLLGLGLFGGGAVTSDVILWRETGKFLRQRRSRRAQQQRGFAVLMSQTNRWHDPQRMAVLTQLGDEMSRLSLRCWQSGWLQATEYLIPELCRRAIVSGQSQTWGHDHLSLEEAKQLTKLASELGCWANLDQAGEGYEPFDPFPIPQQYLDEIEQEQAHG